MEKRLEEIISFLRNYYEGINFGEIDQNTRLEEDLGITGDEAWDFFCDFSRTFNMDISQFLMYDYFKPEGIDLFSGDIKFFPSQKTFCKKGVYH